MDGAVARPRVGITGVDVGGLLTMGSLSAVGVRRTFVAYVSGGDTYAQQIGGSQARRNKQGFEWFLKNHGHGSSSSTFYCKLEARSETEQTRARVAKNRQKTRFTS